MKKLFTFLVLIVSMYALQGQQLEAFTAAGTSAVSPDGTLSWTVGEFVTETYVSASEGKTLTQGILQPDLIITAIDDPAKIDFIVNLYPNPTISFVILETDQLDGISYELYDISGNILEKSLIVCDKTEISFETLPASTYFIKVIKNKEMQMTYKIVKQ